ncbi:hypothetical protein SY88_15555 [Clostridiales bacterium PH28_bin88]|nr:hypothetical protein SY88_15555 [Clostridiales bacterium PH28_bin88]
MKDIKQEIKAGKPVLGVFIGIPSPQLVEIAALNGFDFVIIDEEHGTAGVSGATESMILAAYSSDIYPVVRPPMADQGSILRPLDMGAKGIQVPQTSTKEQVEAVVQFTKYPPIGKRGTAFSTRMAKYGFNRGREALDKANEETLVIVHIENQEGLSRVDDILSVPGLDVVFIGITDLSVSLGYPGETDHPVVARAIDDIIEKGLEARVQVGILITDPDTALKWVDKGITYLATGITGVINKGCQWMVKGFKGK